MERKNRTVNSKRRVREDSILDVRNPEWGDNLPPDSKYLTWNKYRGYINMHPNREENLKGRDELANVLMTRAKIKDGTMDPDELDKALEKEYEELEELKKQLGRDFRPDEVVEMLLYLNDMLKKAGINLRPDLMSKKDYLKAMSEVEAALEETLDKSYTTPSGRGRGRGFQRESSSRPSKSRRLQELKLMDILEKEHMSSNQGDEEFILWRVDAEGNPTKAIASFVSFDRAKQYAKDIVRKKTIITVGVSQENLDDYEYYPEDEVWSSF